MSCRNALHVHAGHGENRLRVGAVQIHVRGAPAIHCSTLDRNSAENNIALNRQL
jgi:hypothetical protein